MNTFSKQRKVNSVTIEIQQQQYFISSQLSLNLMAPHIAVPIEAGQENHWKKKKMHTKKINIYTLQI